MGPFEGDHHYLHYLHHGLVSDQTTEREHSPAHQTENWIKDLLSMAPPIRTGPRSRLAHECPGVSGEGVGWQWPTTGLGALSAAVTASDLLKEITIIFITSTMVWSQIKQQRGNTALPIKQKIGLKIY